MIEYPKIETLYNRDEAFKVVPGQLRMPEFDLPKYWSVTEKIDGTNIRVGLADGRVSFAGRTDRAQIPGPLFHHLATTFPADKLTAAFSPGVNVVLFGEGYGEKIQNGGDYRAGVGFILFDVWVDGWWLEPENIADVAAKLDIETVPTIDFALIFMSGLVHFPQDAKGLAMVLGINKHGDGKSILAASNGRERQAEGIVARTKPLLFTQDGRRLMWKLKFKDFDKPLGRQ